MRKNGILALLAAVVLAACSLNGGGNWSGDPEKINSIREGMTQAEVKSILGEATEVVDQEMMAGMRLTIWEYRGPNDRLTVGFEPEKGTVWSTARNGAEIISPKVE